MNQSERKAMADQFDGITKALEAETKYKYICLENPFTNNMKLDDITKEHHFKVSHLLLQKKHYNAATKFSKKVSNVSENWMGGGTQCGNTIWHMFMFPKMKELGSLVHEKKWSRAFGSVMGIFLYLNCDTQFLTDHSIDLDSISGWCYQFSNLWLDILQQSDKVLGLDCGDGLPGGYRAPLLVLLRKQQRDLNSELSTIDDDLIDDMEFEGDAPIVAIFDKAGKLIDDSEEENKENSGQVEKKGKGPVLKKTSNADVIVKNVSAILKSVETVSMYTSRDTLESEKENVAKKRAADPLERPVKKAATVTPKKTSAKVAPVRPKFVPTEQVTRSGRKSKTVDRF